MSGCRMGHQSADLHLTKHAFVFARTTDLDGPNCYNFFRKKSSPIDQEIVYKRARSAGGFDFDRNSDRFFLKTPIFFNEKWSSEFAKIGPSITVWGTFDHGCRSEFRSLFAIPLLFALFWTLQLHRSEFRSILYVLNITKKLDQIIPIDILQRVIQQCLLNNAADRSSDR